MPAHELLFQSCSTCKKTMKWVDNDLRDYKNQALLDGTVLFESHVAMHAYAKRAGWILSTYGDLCTGCIAERVTVDPETRKELEDLADFANNIAADDVEAEAFSTELKFDEGGEWVQD